MCERGLFAAQRLVLVASEPSAAKRRPLHGGVGPPVALQATPTNADNAVARRRAHLEEAESLNPQLTNCASLGRV
ncbi:MAG TPA: hypothetical protein VI755_06695 [Anaerolineales bacterium]|nr:hypothetical protein [Anaerolineales bacterium]